ncbi:MAG TPA: hypothetical protein VFA77_03655 [Candidatus Eisenbacteria bacterium]|nr:hypothetical protein [Candidatus Eisenbacteria bacterium]
MTLKAAQKCPSPTTGTNERRICLTRRGRFGFDRSINPVRNAAQTRLQLAPPGE